MNIRDCMLWDPNVVGNLVEIWYTAWVNAVFWAHAKVRSLAPHDYYSLVRCPRPLSSAQADVDFLGKSLLGRTDSPRLSNLRPSILKFLISAYSPFRCTPRTMPSRPACSQNIANVKLPSFPPRHYVHTCLVIFPLKVIIIYYSSYW